MQIVVASLACRRFKRFLPSSRCAKALLMVWPVCGFSVSAEKLALLQMWLSEDCATLQNQSFWHSYEANCLNMSFFFFKVSPLIKLFPSLTCRYSFCVGGLWIVVLKGTAHSQCLMLVSSSLGFFCVKKGQRIY